MHRGYGKKVRGFRVPTQITHAWHSAHSKPSVENQRDRVGFDVVDAELGECFEDDVLEKVARRKFYLTFFRCARDVCTKRQFCALFACYYLPLTLKEIAHRMCLSDTRVRQLKENAERNLRWDCKYSDEPSRFGKVAFELNNI